MEPVWMCVGGSQPQSLPPDPRVASSYSGLSLNITSLENPSLPPPHLVFVCPITLFNIIFFKYSNCIYSPSKMSGPWEHRCLLIFIVFYSLQHPICLVQDLAHNRCPVNVLYGWTNRFSKTPIQGSTQQNCSPAEPNITPEPAACPERWGNALSRSFSLQNPAH